MNIQSNLLLVLLYLTFSYLSIIVESNDTVQPASDNNNSTTETSFEDLVDGILILHNRLDEVKKDNQKFLNHFVSLKNELYSFKQEYESFKNSHIQDPGMFNCGNMVNPGQQYQSVSNLLGAGRSPINVVPSNTSTQEGPGYINPSNGQSEQIQGQNYSELVELVKKLKKENEKLKKEVIDNRTPVSINIDGEEATKEFCYENDTYRQEKIFKARKGFGIQEVLGTNSRGEQGYIWRANDNSEFAIYVVLSLADINSKILTINCFDGSKKVFRRDNNWHM